MNSRFISLNFFSFSLNLQPNLSSEIHIKKPCPLEMSIKAANIDLEFEKCDPTEVLVVPNGILECETLPSGLVEICQPNLDNNVAEAMMVNQMMDTKLGEIKHMMQPEPMKNVKTEITWDNNNINETNLHNEFRESLICEVEEANEEEEENNSLLAKVGCVPVKNEGGRNLLFFTLSVTNKFLSLVVF